MSKFTLAVVRHGISLANERGLVSGSTDVPLTNAGRVALRRLRTCVEYPETDRYYSSDLSRARDTFKVLYDGKATLDGIRPEFRELHFGSLEYKPGPPGGLKTVLLAWLSGQTACGVEPYSEFSRRLVEGTKRLSEDCLREGARSATVVTHSCVIRTLLVELGGFPKERWMTFPAPNGLGYVMDLDCAGPRPRLIEVLPIEDSDTKRAMAVD